MNILNKLFNKKKGLPNVERAKKAMDTNSFFEGMECFRREDVEKFLNEYKTLKKNKVKVCMKVLRKDKLLDDDKSLLKKYINQERIFYQYIKEILFQLKPRIKNTLSNLEQYDLDETPEMILEIQVLSKELNSFLNQGNYVDNYYRGILKYLEREDVQGLELRARIKQLKSEYKIKELQGLLISLDSLIVRFNINIKSLSKTLFLYNPDGLTVTGLLLCAFLSIEITIVLWGLKVFKDTSEVRKLEGLRNSQMNLFQESLYEVIGTKNVPEFELL